ncbi:hypothetical protein [Salsuginibacillus kocurii]|uniref:hypothetical protein n=1 Tax=Salsuginibacillus kocurii TaxID=427078 RepID=UPI00037DE42F|nr:hypothetical protein [Salsuginibacillus kocurii]
MPENKQALENAGVLGPFSISAKMTFVYVLLFVALMLLFDGVITVNGVGLPAVGLFLILSAAKSIISLKTDRVPQWFILSSFALTVVTAVAMTILFT